MFAVNMLITVRQFFADYMKVQSYDNNPEMGTTAHLNTKVVAQLVLLRPWNHERKGEGGPP